MIEIDKAKNFIQKVKVEFLAEDVERSTEKETEIDRAYARGWNKCQKTILSNISEVFREEVTEKICEEVSNLCKKADLEFFFCIEGRSEWSVSKSTHLRELVDYHKKAVEKEEAE